MNFVDRSEHLDEFVEIKALKPPDIVGNNVLRDGKNLLLDVTTNSNGAVTTTAGSYVDSVDHQPTLARLRLVDEAVSNTATDGAPSLHRNSNAVSALHADTRTMPELRLLPPTAFMSRTDGTPILDTETGCGQVSRMSVFKKHEQRMERDGDNSDGKVPCGSRTKDAEDTASDCRAQMENVGDNATELLYIRQTLRTFADNKDKLKFVTFSLALLISRCM